MNESLQNTTAGKDARKEEDSRAEHPLIGAGPRLNKMESSPHASSKRSRIMGKQMNSSGLVVEMDVRNPSRSEPKDDLFETDDENSDSDMAEIDRCNPRNFEYLRLLSLLLWKNLLVQSIRRHYILTAFEVFLPLIFPLIFAIKNATFDNSGLKSPYITVYAPMGEKELMRNLYEQIECPNCLIAFAPASDYNNLIIDKMNNLFTDPDYNSEAKNSTTVWKGFNSELELEADWQLHVQSGNTSFKAAIIFENGFSPSGKLPQNHTFSYTIRIPELCDEIDLITGMYPQPEQNASDPHPKVASALQILIDKVLVDQISEDGFPNEAIQLQAFPRLRTPVTNSQTIGKYFKAIFPMLLSLGFIFIIPSVVGAIVREKESGMRELLRANGLPREVNCLGWLLKSITIAPPTVYAVCFLLFVPFNLDVGAIVKNWWLFLYWLPLLFVFATAASSWCVLISSLCDQMVVAVAAGMYVWVLSYLLWAATFLYQLSTGWKYVFSIFPNLALTFAAETLLKLDEALIKGASSEDPLVVKDLTSLFYKILSETLACTFLYVILGLYLENVLPTRFGARRPWNFFIQSLLEVCKEINRPRKVNIENVSSNVVRTYRLKKSFPGKTIDYASVRFESGQTTVLVGENGAGKSTLLSMIAGIQLGNEGSACINGRSIETFPKLERQNVGYCPQLNTFFNDLTVHEHLEFFAKLKRIRTNVDLLRGRLIGMKNVGLRDESNKLPSALSGGQKRKLNIAMAIAGNPGVLLLDEPTSGVDVDGIERLLDEVKRPGRTTLITSPTISELYKETWRVAVFDKGKLKMVKKSCSVDYMNRTYNATSETDTTSSVSCSGRPLTNQNVEHRREDHILGFKRLRMQFRALILKRFLQTWRNKRLLIVQFIIPLVVSIIAIYGGNQIRHQYPSQPNATRLELAAYENPVILFSSSISAQYNDGIFTSLVPRGSEKVANINESLVKIAADDSKRYRDHYILAVELDSFELKAMFSSTQPGSAAIALNVAANYILRTKSGNDRPSIEVNMNPLTNKVPAALDAANPRPAFVTRVALFMVATLPVGLAFLAAGFVVVPVSEEGSKVKLLQFMTGVSGWIYWGSSFLWDFLLMAVASGFMTLLIATGWEDTFWNKTAMGVMFLMFMAYGFVAICLSYLFSSISRQVSNAPSAFTIVMTIHFLSGTIGTTVVYTLEMLKDLAGIAPILSYFMSVLPSFAITWSILRFTEIATTNSRCKAVDATFKKYLCDPKSAFDLRYRSCCDLCNENFPEAPCFEPQPYLELFSTRNTGQISIQGIGIGMELLIMVAVGFGCLILLAVFSRHGAKTSTDKLSSSSGLQASNVCKSHNSRSAVSDVHLEAKPGELFALVGYNGAGKSTTLRILAGDELPSQGRVRIGQLSMEKDWRRFGFFSKKYLSQIGYCPQHDGLIEALTGREILRLFVSLLGLAQGNGRDKIEYWIKNLGLESAQDIQCRNLTGGMKRRLSLVIAIIGSPSVILLDEPTAGVDPKGRERLWKVIDGMKSSNRSIIVSTHDTEECGKLCSSFGMMSDGEMREIRSVDGLKQKYFDVTAGIKGAHDEQATFMTLMAIATKYRPGVEKIGKARMITPDMNGVKYWLSLRERDNEEKLKKFQQKILNEVILHAGDYGPGFRNNGLPRHTIMDAEKGIEQLLSYLTQKCYDCNSNCNNYTCADIEPKMSGTENAAQDKTIAAEKYSINRRKEWLRSIFDKQRSRVSDPKDEESCNSEETLKCTMAPPPGIIPVLCLKITNRINWDYRREPYLDGPEPDLDNERYPFKGPNVVRMDTTETFHLRKNDMGKELEPVWLGLTSIVDLVIACMELEHGVLLLSVGFLSRICDYHYEKLPAEAVLDLPACTDSCTIRIDSLTAQYESFAKLGYFLVRVYVPVEPQAIYRTIEVDIFGIDEQVLRSACLDHSFKNSSLAFQYFYVQPLLRLLNNPRKWDCVVLIDIAYSRSSKLISQLLSKVRSALSVPLTKIAPILPLMPESLTEIDSAMHLNLHQNFLRYQFGDPCRKVAENSLNVSLTNGTERKISNEEDSVAGTSNSCRPDIPGSRKLDPPREVLASTREIFYECGSMPIQRIFSYKIESTDIGIVVGLKVQGEDSSFAFAFVESSAVDNETFETLMDPSKSKNLEHRKFGYAKNGEEVVQIRNIITFVSMTEPKYMRMRRKDPPSTSFSLHEDNGYNVNSQLYIRIVTV